MIEFDAELLPQLAPIIRFQLLLGQRQAPTGLQN
jgi:hypothetical protein